MMKQHQEDRIEPFVISEGVEAELIAAGYEYAPPSHGRTTSLPEILAGLTDSELGTWLSVFLEVEIERRRAGQSRQV